MFELREVYMQFESGVMTVGTVTSSNNVSTNFYNIGEIHPMHADLIARFGEDGWEEMKALLPEPPPEENPMEEEEG